MLKHAKEHSGSVVVQMRAQLADKEVREGREDRAALDNLPQLPALSVWVG